MAYYLHITVEINDHDANAWEQEITKRFETADELEQFWDDCPASWVVNVNDDVTSYIKYTPTHSTSKAE